MSTPSAEDKPPPPPRRNIFAIIGTALLGAHASRVYPTCAFILLISGKPEISGGGIFLPMITFFAAMILAGLTSNCSNDSGGCAMWAGGVAIASAPVWAVIIFALTLYSGLKSR